ncbi:MAG: AMP-binding protein [Candidatus Lokiarchaeota archaeon]|nr:AMP-binding protein [Candidatus Lokiarchaeota archaeon]
MRMVKWDKIPKVKKPWLEFWPQETPRQMEYENIPLDEILRRNKQKYPNQDAIYFMDYRITMAELDMVVDKFASGLAKIGIKQGDVVLIDTPNIPQFVIAFYAIMRLGAVANPIIPLNRYAEIVHQVNDSKGKVLIILDYLYEEYLHGKDLARMPTLEKIILTGLGEYVSTFKRVLGTLFGKIPRMKKWPTAVGNIDFLKFQDILNSEISLPEVNIDPMNDTAVLIYTGGTTGAPKGVETTHFNLMANCQQGYKFVTTQLPKTLDTIGKGGMIIVLPLAHSFALSLGMNLGMWCGYTLILFPQPPVPLSDMLKIIVKENATFAPGVPTLWNKINQDPKSESYREDLLNTDFIACLSGAAPLPLEVKLKFEELTGAKLIEGYGMSEASPLLTGNPFTRSVENTVGLPVPDTYLKIVDLIEGKDILEQCPFSEEELDAMEQEDQSKYIGEICGSGPQIMKGYLNRPEASEYALRTDEDGITWYYTADIGYIDPEGYLRIKDRKRDMIKYKGHSVFPREIEDLMYQYDPINEVGVYGLKDANPEIGESINAVVSLKPEYKDKVDENDVKAWVKENIAPYKYPRNIKIMDELPKSLIGKVLRRVLREEGQKEESNKKL